MTTYEKFLNNSKLRRSTVLFIIIVILWIARSVMSTILFTFIFSFLVTRLLNFVRRHVLVKAAAVVVPIYLIVVGVIGYALVHFVPIVIDQTVTLGNSLITFYHSKALDNNPFMQSLLDGLEQLNLSSQIQNGVRTILAYAGSVTTMGITLFLSLVLSFFYTLEIDELKTFGSRFTASPLGWVFQDVKFFADKFINTFGIVIESQIFIALVNTLITTITLIFMGMPSIPGLAMMVFLLSLIPVAGAFVSVIPLAIVAYTVDGVQGVVAIVVMIIIIHTLEAYVLNPKFMSSRTKLPVFFTFVVLLGGEKLFGTWGLIVGLPIFTFFLDIFGIKKITPVTVQAVTKINNHK